jgi:tRNA 2-(methylsulfanyl)-N6-isopentenyladenosine37 hydroxylase
VPSESALAKAPDTLAKDIATDIFAKIETLPLHSRTPAEWGRAALSDPIALLIDHAFLEKKAANNAMELMTRWPNDWTDNNLIRRWIETMTSVARDEAAHLAQTVRLLDKRGGHLDRVHKNPYANELRLLVRKGSAGENIDRLFVSALIEARSCERFALLTVASNAKSDVPEIAAFYKALFSSELGHYKVFLKLAYKVAPKEVVDARWQYMLEKEAQILSKQEPGPRIHSGWHRSPNMSPFQKKP